MVDLVTLVSAGSIYTEQTLAVAVTLIMILAASLQVAREYFLRILRKFTLRLGADIWWLLYILLKDAGIFLTLFLGFLVFFPGTFQDYPIAVPFQPLGIDMYAAALLLILLRDTEEDQKLNNIVTILIILGTFLYIFGVVFIAESALALSVLPSTVSASTSNFWGFLNTYFNSQNNPNLAIYTFYVTFAILLGLAGAATMSALKGAFTPKSVITTMPKPVVKLALQEQQPSAGPTVPPTTQQKPPGQ